MSYGSCKVLPKACAVDVRSVSLLNGNSMFTFAVSTLNNVITPDKEPISTDELERLEKLHQKMKEETEAWHKLLENLGKLRTKQNENPEPKTSHE
mgnify:CR=1 FL=1